MDKYRKIGIIVGILYILGTVFGVMSVALMGNTSDFTQIATNSGQFTAGALFILLMGIVLAFIPIILYPILKTLNEVLAMGYVIFRGAIETMGNIISFVGFLLLLHLGQSYQALILGGHDLILISNIFIFGLGALMLYLILYQSKLIPRWISLWGIIAIVLHLIKGFLLIFGVVTDFSMIGVLIDMPIFFQEMVMAIWFIVKGFNFTFIENTKKKTV